MAAAAPGSWRSSGWRGTMVVAGLDGEQENVTLATEAPTKNELLDALARRLHIAVFGTSLRDCGGCHHGPSHKAEKGGDRAFLEECLSHRMEDFNPTAALFWGRARDAVDTLEIVGPGPAAT